MDQMKEKLSKSSMVCWSIWKARNDVVWNNKSVRAGNVVSSTIAYLTQWEKVQSMGKVTSHLPVVSKGSTEQWTKQDPSSVKVNCDAALFKRAGQYGVGCIVRDDKGELLYAASICFVGRSGVHYAEAIGKKESLSWIKAKVDSVEGSGDPMPHLR
ncbi:uncharacterized protein LOC141720118 [Apium graveolens]|uniref:uncharacterized protein LOC141720118 n=1 Tax=Apium graveolens TaxID=4045 RepID=UPI003D7A27D1